MYTDINNPYPERRETRDEGRKCDCIHRPASIVLHHTNARGFTLIEIIAAMTVLLVGVVGILSLFPAAYRMTELSKITTRMTIIGQSKLDECIALGFANLPVGTATLQTADLARFIPDAAERTHYRNSRITVQTAPGHVNSQALNPLNNQPVLKRIDVTIAYEMRPGKEKTEVFSMYISNPLHG